MTLRLAISGSAGTGKSTLGRLLAGELGLPFVEEGMRSRLEAGLEPHRLSAEEWLELHRELWREHERSVVAGQTGGFVADRCSADFAAFRIHYDQLRPEQASDAEIRRLLERLELYDRVLLLPWGTLPLVEDGTRSTARWTQFRFHSILEGLLRRFARPGQLLELPGLVELEERRRWVLEVLGEEVR